MANAKKTVSGKWRITIYDYRDSTGKTHQKTFTAETKKEVERMANEYKSNPLISDLTIGEAVNNYITVKSASLSPSTVRGYNQIYKNQFESSRFGGIKLEKLDNITLQRYVSDLVADKSPKTIKNIYGLLVSAVRMYRPGVSFSVTLPAAKKPELYTPTTAEIGVLLDSIKKDRDLYICVLLCAFAPLRRSEACALKYDDIDYKKNTITIRRAKVKDKEHQWVVKDIPKNYTSYRTVILPAEVIKAIGRGFGYVIDSVSPDGISDRFKDALTAAGLPHFRLHDLRHYSASILHAIGIPDQYIMARGGWKTDHVMKRVYRDTISDVEKEMNDKINTYFEKSIAK
jgi:integrase